MLIDDFARYSQVLHRLTADFIRAVPEDLWDFVPPVPEAARGASGRERLALFAPFPKQVRHVVCVRGVYNAALATGKVDWARKHGHYDGPLTREVLLDALDAKQRELLATLPSVDAEAMIDWEGTPFSFSLFTWEFVQHEAIHHGQWSLYASLAGFETPPSWHTSWGL